MPRVYFNLEGGAGQRYYYGLDVVPGGIMNSEPAVITLRSSANAIQELTEVFRTPATLTITLSAPLATIQPRLIPATATITASGLTATIGFQAIITPALVLDYETPADLLPTLLTQMTVQPAQATITLVSPAVNLTQGGDIRTITPPVGLITLGALAPNFPFFAVAPVSINVIGLVPTLHMTAVIQPQAATITVLGLDPTLQTPFRWIDEDPATTPVWLDDPRA
jgi:hypothetical protein